MNSFSEILRTLRLDAGLKQSDIAENLGVSIQSYSAYENGREPNFSILLKLSDIFNVSTDYLIGATLIKNKNELDFLKNITTEKTFSFPNATPEKFNNLLTREDYEGLNINFTTQLQALISFHNQLHDDIKNSLIRYQNMTSNLENKLDKDEMDYYVKKSSNYVKSREELSSFIYDLYNFTITIQENLLGILSTNLNNDK